MARDDFRRIGTLHRTRVHHGTRSIPNTPDRFKITLLSCTYKTETCAHSIRWACIPISEWTDMCTNSQKPQPANNQKACGSLFEGERWLPCCRVMENYQLAKLSHQTLSMQHGAAYIAMQPCTTDGQYSTVQSRRNSSEWLTAVPLPAGETQGLHHHVSYFDFTASTTQAYAAATMCVKIMGSKAKLCL